MLCRYRRQLEVHFRKPKAAIMLGKRAENLIGENAWVIFTDDIGTAYHKVCYKAMKTKKQITFENYYAPWDRWFDNRGTY
jgi:hypothetical protein